MEAADPQKRPAVRAPSSQAGWEAPEHAAARSVAGPKPLVAMEERLEAGPKLRGLARLQGALDASPKVRGLAQLQSALDARPDRSGEASGGHGLPARLKAGVEHLSGQRMDDVRVTYDSPEPAQLKAAAFTRGPEIHIGRGQERHLPHEAWHAAQQKQGRVTPTTQFGGADINADPELEREADVMGPLVAAGGHGAGAALPEPDAAPSGGVVQGVFDHLAGPQAGTVQRSSGNMDMDLGEDVEEEDDEEEEDVEADRDGDVLMDGDGADEDDDAPMEEEPQEIDGMVFKQAKPGGEKPHFVAKTPGLVRETEERKTPSLTFHVVARPMEDKKSPDGKYDPDDLEIASLAMSDERPPTRFEGAQESHSVAFRLIRTALQNFQGRPVVNLLHFLRGGFAELASEDETEAAAREMATRMIPEGMFDTLDGARLPLQVWSGILSDLLYNYEVAYHLGGSAVFKKGAAKSRGEQFAGPRLDDAEAQLAADKDAKLDDIYSEFPGKKVPRPTPVSDALTLLDINFTLPKEGYIQALKHWYTALWLAYPHVMGEIGDKLSKQVLETPTSGQYQKMGEFTVGQWIAKLDAPGYQLPKQQAGIPEIGDMRQTPQAIQIRIDPLFDSDDRAADGSRPAPPQQYVLDELATGRIQMGEARLATQSGREQRSHTVAWTLIRAAIMGFSSQPLANLVFYLIQGLDDLAQDESKEMVDEDDSGQEGAGEVAAALREAAEGSHTLPDWQIIVAQAAVAYLRLDQRSKNATFGGSGGGKAEGEAMQILRQNEMMLASRGELFNTPEKVVESAARLLDAELGHPNLPWQTVAKSVLRWEEALRQAFPNLMLVGGARIVKSWSQRKIPPDWADVPKVDGDGKAIATVGDLVRHARHMGVVGEEATVPLSGGDAGKYHSLAAMPGQDGHVNAFAVGLVGLIAEGVLTLEQVAAKLPSLSEEVLADLASLLATPQSSPAGRRAIQRIVAPALRAELTALVAKTKPSVEPQTIPAKEQAEILANHFGIHLTTIQEGADAVEMSSTKTGMDLESAPMLGLHGDKAGNWATVKTVEGGRFDLAGGGRGTLPERRGTGSQLPERVEEQLRAQMHERSEREQTVEGTFPQGGQAHVVWRTTGDNNCSFNGMALVLAGLVAQGGMAAGALADRLALPEETINRAAAAAGKAQSDAAQARQVETLLAGPLRQAAVAALKGCPDIQAQMEQEFFGEVRGSLLLHFTGRRSEGGDLFSAAPIHAMLEARTQGMILAIGQECDGKTNEEKEATVNAAMEKSAEQIQAFFKDTVMPAYLAQMGADGVWAGAPELQALARSVGVHLSIFRDQGGGIFSRDEGVAGAGSASAATLSDADMDKLRSLDIIEGRPRGLQNLIYFRRIPAESVAAKLEGFPELAAKFIPLYEGGYRGASVEIGMFRHRTRAHWSAMSTAVGAYNLQDPTNRLDGLPITAGIVDSGLSRQSRSYARMPAGQRPQGGGGAPAGMVVARFTSQGAEHNVWRTSGDNNCSFNGMAQVIAGLVAQGRMTPDTLAGALGGLAPSMDELLKAAAESRQNPAAAKKVEQMLSDPLRQLAVTALDERQDLKTQMAEEFIGELRGHVYALLGLPWHRSSDLFERGNPGIQRYLGDTAAKLAKALEEDCKGKVGAEKEKAIDAGIEKDMATALAWFNDMGMKDYLGQMRRSGVWGGAPELQALAGRLGVSLSIFRDFGNGVVTRDEGLAGAGSASAATLSDEEIARLRSLDIIEGRPRGPDNRIYFRRISAKDIEAKLKALPVLEGKFMPLFEPNYRRAPVEIGMFRHTYAHWSAVTTGHNASDLADPSDRRGPAVGGDGADKGREAGTDSNLHKRRHQPDDKLDAKLGGRAVKGMRTLDSDWVRRPGLEDQGDGEGTDDDEDVEDNIEEESDGSASDHDSDGMHE